MSELDDLRRRVDRLESRAEISELASAYGVACDEHDMDRLLGLFTEDAIFDSPSGTMKARGRAEIESMFVKMFKIRGPAFHWTHDHFIRMSDTDPDAASGLILSHAETTPNDEVSLAAMRYADDYRRVNGRWLFAKRIINFLYYVPARDFPTSLSSKTRFTVSGERRTADYPESLAVWKEFDRKHRPDVKAEEENKSRKP